MLVANIADFARPHDPSAPLHSTGTSAAATSDKEVFRGNLGGREVDVEAKLEQILQREELILALLRSQDKNPVPSCCYGGGSKVQQMSDVSFSAASPASSTCGGGNQYTGRSDEEGMHNTRPCSQRWHSCSLAESLRDVLPPVEGLQLSSLVSKTLYSARVRSPITAVESPSKALSSSPPLLDNSARAAGGSLSHSRGSADFRGSSCVSSLPMVPATDSAVVVTPAWVTRKFFAARLPLSPLAAASSSAARPSPLLAPQSQSKLQPLCSLDGCNSRETVDCQQCRKGGKHQECDSDFDFRSAISLPLPPAVVAEQNRTGSLENVQISRSSSVARAGAPLRSVLRSTRSRHPPAMAVAVDGNQLSKLQKCSDVSREAKVEGLNFIRAAEVVDGTNRPEDIRTAAKCSNLACGEQLQVCCCVDLCQFV